MLSSTHKKRIETEKMETNMEKHCTNYRAMQYTAKQWKTLETESM